MNTDQDISSLVSYRKWISTRGQMKANDIVAENTKHAQEPKSLRGVLTNKRRASQ